MKKFLTILVVAVMAVSMTVSASAIDLPDKDILGYWKLDGNLDNAAGGDPAEYIGTKFAEPLCTPDEYTWIKGVDGQGWMSDTSDGISFGNPKSNNFTMMLWVKSDNCPFATPILWFGDQNQADGRGKGGESWLGIWPDLQSSWGVYGPCIGSCNLGARVAVHATDNVYADLTSELPWIHIAASFSYEEETDTVYGKLYWNGALVGENSGIEAPWSEVSGIYFGVNYWDAAIMGYIDDVIIFNETLTDDEIAAIYAQYGEPPAEIEYVDAGGEEPADTQAPDTQAPETKAPETKAPETQAPDTQAPETKAPEEEKSGCGSAMGAAAVIVALTATLGCAIVKKH